MSGGKRVLKYGCLTFFVSLLVLPLGFCGYLSWRGPRGALPKEIEWSDVLAFGSTFDLREGCSFGAYRISDKARYSFLWGGKLPAEWRQTPITIRDGRYADLGPDGSEITLYALHATDCASAKARRYRLVEAYEHALSEPGSWVKIINHGEAMVVVSPQLGLAWFLNFG